jgi:hypothetical protein
VAASRKFPSPSRWALANEWAFPEKPQSPDTIGD